MPKSEGKIECFGVSAVFLEILTYSWEHLSPVPTEQEVYYIFQYHRFSCESKPL